MKALVFSALLLIFGAATMAQDGGTIVQAEFDSVTLGRPYQYNIYLPAGYDASSQLYPVIYLLHGRGDTMAGWTTARNTLDALIADGSVPPMIAVMPDFPSSDRAGYYVDSQYTGTAAPPAEAVETAFFDDLIPHVDATYRTSAGRTARLIGGYSMGGYGALRYALAHPEMFVGALVLSPAVYIPLPPVDSSTREFGAFGRGDSLFDAEIYTALNYPALLPAFSQTGLGLSMFIAVGDDEWKNERVEDMLHDLDIEAHMVFNHVARVPSIRSEFRVYDGGHDWDVWQRGLAEGLPYLSRQISIVGVGDAGMQPPTVVSLDPTLGTDEQDFAGGIAQAADGTTVVALAAGGSMDGQTHIGGLDLALTRRAPDGTTAWTRQIGTPANDRPYGVALDAQENAIVAGYTAGDLNGAHASSTADDAFVVKVDRAGNVLWTLQFGDPDEADRIYGMSVGSGGEIYVTGYTRGVIGDEHAGDKDVFVAQVSADGELVWIDQFGGAGEDKGYSVAVGGDRLYVAGVFVTDSGGLDAHLTAYSASGERLWTQTFGTPDWDEAQSVAIGPDSTVYVAGFVAGSLAGGNFGGDKDAFVAAFDPGGTMIASSQFGGAGNDKAAAVVATDAGQVFVASYSDDLGGGLGGFDLLVSRYDASLDAAASIHFGSTADDGADEYAEKNLFLALAGERLLMSGLTGADVFFMTVEPDGG